MKLATLMYALYTLISVSFHFVGSCPRKCTCHQAQQLASCNNTNITNEELKFIARNLSLNTRVIDLTGNLISEFPVKDFSHLLSLYEINLSHNKIEALPSNLSQYLPQVESLSLQFNKITEIRKKNFVRYEKLKLLTLHHNRISNLPSKVFAYLKELTTLSLNDNNISAISKNAFEGLSNLNYLHLFRNPLLRIESGTFADPPLIELNIYNTNLETIPSHLVSAKRLISILNLKNNSITHIFENAFYNSGIAGLYLAHNYITTLNKDMFNGSSLIEKLDVSGNNLMCDCSMSKFLKSLYTKKVIGSCSSPPVVSGQDLENFTKNNISCTSCLNHSCRNNATCKPINKKRFNCECKKGFVGSLCESIDHCFGSPCKNNGSCKQSGLTQYKCVCNGNYYGKHCEEIKNGEEKWKKLHPGWILLTVTSIVILIY